MGTIWKDIIAKNFNKVKNFCSNDSYEFGFCIFILSYLQLFYIFKSMTTQSTPAHFPLLFGGIFGGVGLILLVASMVVYYYQTKSRENTVLVKGKVIDMTSYRDSKGSRMYSPIIEFQFNNQNYQITSEVASSPPAFEVGEEVELFVPPANPKQATIDSFMEKWFVVLILGFMGSIFSLIGFLVMRSGFKKGN
jgi:hypothetical protein